MTGRFAALADIHGNVWALEAVLEHAKRRGVTQCVNLGDVLYGPLRPQETFLRLQKERVLATVAGNEDRIIVEASVLELGQNRTLRFVLEDLGTEAVHWLRQLPITTVLDGDVLLCHGSPSNDTVYLLEDVTSGHAVVRTNSEVRRLFEKREATLDPARDAKLSFTTSIGYSPHGQTLPAWKAVFFNPRTDEAVIDQIVRSIDDLM